MGTAIEANIREELSRLFPRLDAVVPEFLSEAALFAADAAGHVGLYRAKMSIFEALLPLENHLK